MESWGENKEFRGGVEGSGFPWFRGWGLGLGFRV